MATAPAMATITVNDQGDLDSTPHHTHSEFTSTMPAQQPTLHSSQSVPLNHRIPEVERQSAVETDVAITHADTVDSNTSLESTACSRYTLSFTNVPDFENPADDVHVIDSRSLTVTVTDKNGDRILPGGIDRLHYQQLYLSKIQRMKMPMMVPSVNTIIVAVKGMIRCQSVSFLASAARLAKSRALALV